MKLSLSGQLSALLLGLHLLSGATTAEEISFVYDGYIGGNSLDSTSKSILFTMTYESSFNNPNSEFPTLIFETAWFRPEDIGKTFSAKESAGFEAFLSKLTDGKDQKIHMWFGKDFPYDVNRPIGGGFEPAESLIFSGCTDDTQGSPCNSIGDVLVPNNGYPDLVGLQITDITMTIIDAEIYRRYESNLCPSGCATFEADLKIEFVSEKSGSVPLETFSVKLEEPVNSGIASGISNVRGWAVSSQGIQKIELFVDGQYVFEIPYGGQRLDVEAVFPEITQSAESGFGSTYNYGRLSSGEHTMTVRAYAMDGRVKDSTSVFTVVGFGQEYIAASDSPRANNASVSIESSNADIVIRDIELDSGERFEVRLRWDTAAQSYKAVAVQPLN